MTRQPDSSNSFNEKISCTACRGLFRASIRITCSSPRSRMSSSINAPDAVIQYARSARRRFIAELCNFLRFPSVSSNPKYARDVRACAAWLARHLRDIGLANARLLETGGAPIVYAESFPSRSPYPTVLIYGHYDVQPPEPLDAWR